VVRQPWMIQICMADRLAAFVNGTLKLLIIYAIIGAWK